MTEPDMVLKIPQSAAERLLDEGEVYLESDIDQSPIQPGSYLITIEDND